MSFSTACGAEFACARTETPACCMIWRDTICEETCAMSASRMRDSDALRFSTDTPTLLIAVSSWFWRAPSFARKVETCPIAASMD